MFLDQSHLAIHWCRARKKTKNKTVVFVHHVGGSHKSTKRHSSLLNEKGFDCVCFDLFLGFRSIEFSSIAKIQKILRNPLLRFLHRGLFYVWSQQIQEVLDKVEGDKILYCFSAPCLSGLWAASNRQDVKKVICDGGPFAQLYKNSKNFFGFQLGLQQKQINALVSFFGIAFWGYRPLSKLHRILSQWQGKPILSIRGEEDSMVFIDSIRSVFEPHCHLDLKVLEIQGGGHLNGLRDFPEIYTKTLFDFLEISP